MADKLKNLLLAALLALMGILLAVTFLVSVRGSSGRWRRRNAMKGRPPPIPPPSPRC